MSSEICTDPNWDEPASNEMGDLTSTEIETHLWQFLGGTL